MIKKRPRVLDPLYLDYIRGQACAICSETRQIEAHHIRYPGECGAGMKPSDYFAAPLCLECHRRIHNEGVRAKERRALTEKGHRLLVQWVETQKLALEVAAGMEPAEEEEGF